MAASLPDSRIVAENGRARALTGSGKNVSSDFLQIETRLCKNRINYTHDQSLDQNAAFSITAHSFATAASFWQSGCARNRAAAPRSHVPDRWSSQIARALPPRHFKARRSVPEPFSIYILQRHEFVQLGFEPLVPQQRPDHHVNSKCQRDDPKIGIP